MIKVTVDDVVIELRPATSRGGDAVEGYCAGCSKYWALAFLDFPAESGKLEEVYSPPKPVLLHAAGGCKAFATLDVGRAYVYLTTGKIEDEPPPIMVDGAADRRMKRAPRVRATVR